MASSGNSCCDIHPQSLESLGAVFGDKVVEFFMHLQDSGCQSIHMHWLTEEDTTDGQLIPVITFSLVEEIRGEV